MIVTRLEETTGKRIKIYLDDTFAFVLYPQDIKRYHIAESREIGREELSAIYQETILRRARQKAMKLLLRMDYSEYGMRQRLKRDLYPDQAIQDTISFLYEYHYLDDVRYAEHYIRAKGDSYGYAELRQRLLGQGIDTDTIQQVYADLKLDEDGVLREQMKKKLSGKQSLSEKERNRWIAYFMRRGFSYRRITECMQALAIDFTYDTFDYDNL
ncbi:MAG: recombination regulator RecX [Lachnospiraceae bacterium]|nr:recombination regulator RecX [Lachnospiraceae bacterium]